MSYYELTRKELQTLCKQNGLPANKSNAVMASSLTTFFSDQQTLTQAYAQVGTPCTVTKSVKSRSVAKPERLETSLASLILGSVKPPGKGGQDTLLKKCKEPLDVADGTLLPNTTPLRRRRKKSDAVKNLPTCAEDATSRDPATSRDATSRDATSRDATSTQDSTENLRLLHEDISVHASRTVVKKSSTPASQVAPHLNADVLATDVQGPPRTRGPERQEVVASRTGVGIVVKKEVLLGSSSESEPVASSSAHDQANVDTLIRRATGMLEKFEQWKIDNPNKDFVHGSGQKPLSFDKENLYQQSPCKNSKLRSLQGYMGGNAAQLDRKEGILKDVVQINAQI